MDSVLVSQLAKKALVLEAQQEKWAAERATRGQIVSSDV